MPNITLKTEVEKVVQKIFDKDGEVRPSELLKAAKEKNSPAHGAFEWNNGKAGEEYRLIQARQWLRVVVIRNPSGDQEGLTHVPRSVSVELSDSGEGSYKPATMIVQNIDEFHRALEEATQRLHAARRAIDELRSIAEKTNQPDRAVMVAQVSRALDIMEMAIQSVH